MCDPLDPGFPSSPGSDPLHSLLANSENHTACAVEPWLDAWPHASQMASEEAFRGQELGTRSMMPRRPVATTVFARPALSYHLPNIFGLEPEVLLSQPLDLGLLGFGISRARSLASLAEPPNCTLEQPRTKCQNAMWDQLHSAVCCKNEPTRLWQEQPFYSQYHEGTACKPRL